MTDIDIDDLISGIVIDSQAEDGVSVAWLASMHGARAAVVACAGRGSKKRSAPWTKEEEDFLRANLGWLTESEIAERLGRSVNGVRIHWKRELRLVSPSRDPNWLPLNQVAILMGVPCAKTVARWVDKFNLLPARRLALNRKTVAVWRGDLIRFATNPRNWLYFNPDRIIDAGIRRLVEYKRKRWNDEWWSVGQVAAYHGVTVGGVNKRIREGGLSAVDYGNWWVLKSHATDPRLKFYRGKGSAETLPWSADLDSWCILARAVGLAFPTIAMLCGWESNRVDVRIRRMSSEHIQRTIDRAGVPVCYNPDTGALWADWRVVANRFPALTLAISRFHAGQTLSAAQLRLLADVLRSWAQWYADTPDKKKRANKLNWHSSLNRDTIQRYLEELQVWGLEVF